MLALFGLVHIGLLRVEDLTEKMYVLGSVPMGGEWHFEHSKKMTCEIMHFLEFHNREMVNRGIKRPIQ